MKVYVVGWGTASHDDGDSSAYGNVHKVYTNYIDAKNGMVSLKDDFYSDIINNPDLEEDIENIEDFVRVYGSVEDGYFEVDEIDIESGDVIHEIYIYLEEKEIIEG